MTFNNGLPLLEAAGRGLVKIGASIAIAAFFQATATRLDSALTRFYRFLQLTCRKRPGN